jgi:hypothetical protein
MYITEIPLAQRNHRLIITPAASRSDTLRIWLISGFGDERSIQNSQLIL